MLFNNIEEVKDKEYNFKSYFTIIVDKNVKEYGSSANAIFEMDSSITSLKVETQVSLQINLITVLLRETVLIIIAQSQLV